MNAPIDMDDPDEDVWDHDTDVLVVGTGAAGHAAAIAAAADGARVVMVDGAAFPGGTTAKSWRATFWIPNNHLMRKNGIDDPRAEAVRYMSRLAFPAAYHADLPHLGLRQCDLALIEAFYDNGPAVIRELEALGAVDPWLDLDIPDYHAELPEDLVPYGRHMRSDGPVGVTVADDEHRLLAGLRHAAGRLGVRTLLEHRVVTLITGGPSGVVGAEIRTRRGTVLIRARHGVVLATGGFTHDADLCAEHLKGPIFGGCANEHAVGDVIRLTTGLGVQLGNMGNAWWGELPVEFALRNRATQTDLFMPFGDSMFYVNRCGRRVFSEKLPYAERARKHFEWDPVEAIYPNLLLFMIYDEHVARHRQVDGRRWPVPAPGDDSSHVVSGANWAQLAERLNARLATLRLPGVPSPGLAADFAGNLADTTERFNHYATTGRDEDFHRGTRAIELAWQEPAPDAGDHRPNPCLRALDPEGPYHAIIIGPSALDTKGGPRTDPGGRIVDAFGRPVPGLYGAGNCVASPSGEAYWAAGATIGLALTFGFIAGRTAAARRSTAPAG